MDAGRRLAWAAARLPRLRLGLPGPWLGPCGVDGSAPGPIKVPRLAQCSDVMLNHSALAASIGTTDSSWGISVPARQ